MATTTFDIALKMDHVCCWECGIPFAVPFNWLEGKCKDDETIYCPNGHETGYRMAPVSDAADVEKLEAANEQLRRELMQEKHNAEQAEGRRAEGRPVVEPVLEPDPAPDPAAPADDRLHCPKCDKTYSQTVRFCRHLADVHNFKSEEAVAALHAEMKRVGLMDDAGRPA